VGALCAQGGVVAGARVDPRRIGQPSEDAFFEAAYQAVEGFWSCCLPKTAGEDPTWGKTSVKKIAMRESNISVRVHRRGQPDETRIEVCGPPWSTLSSTGRWWRC
jgi:hypothetical protein